ncbi:MAG: hypothetical protein R2787_00040 [Saprospiraceae bacterium]
MNHIKIIILLLLCGCLSAANAQKFEIDSIGKQKLEMPVSVSYFGNFIIDPGFKLGIERPFLTIQKTKNKSNGKIKINRHQFFNTLNLGYYYTKELNHTWFLNTELGYRKTRKSGFKTEVLLGVGYLRTFLTDETYEVDNNGNVSIIKNAGSNYFMPSLAFGLGYDNSLKHPNFPMAISIRPNLFFRYPYNSSLLKHIAIEINLSYKFKSPKSNSKYIFKSK